MKLDVVVKTLIFCGLSFSSQLRLSGQEPRSLQRDREGIEALHKLDVETTLSGKADDLAKLWDQDAVRLVPGSPAEIGKATIYATDKREEKAGEGLNACYRPEIKDVQIAGEWAFEWGYFSYKGSPKEKTMRGKVLRVIKRQSDGSWKFARVMAVVDKNGSATAISNPCQ